MFLDAWQTYADLVAEQSSSAPTVPRDRLTFIALSFFDFAVADVARSHLMNVQVVPDFHPSETAYARRYAVAGSRLQA